jgi:coenzyme F420-reducing hydrogenase beta subunit
VSLGGIGTRVDTTLVVVRTDPGLEIMQRMERDGWIEVVDAATADPAAIEIVRKMAASQQRRWPTTVHPATSRQG